MRCPTKMSQNIIIADKNLNTIKRIINDIVNNIENKNIKTFVATNKYEIQEIYELNNINLILINENLNYIYNSNIKTPIFYYRRYYRKQNHKRKNTINE